MTRDEHLALAEEFLHESEKSYRRSVQHATALATIGLLHVALANAKPTTVTPKPPVRDTGWLKLEGR